MMAALLKIPFDARPLVVARYRTIGASRLLQRISCLCLLNLLLLMGIFTTTNNRAAPQRPPVPMLEPPHIPQPPTIDGRLDDPCWQHAPSVAEFWDVNGAAQFKDLAWAKVAIDDDQIYICYRMKADEKSGLPTGSETRDDGVWFSPNVQVFVQPPAAGSYYVFTLNSKNTQEDAKDYENLWDCKWQSATFVAEDKSYWQAEMALPFAAFDLANPPGPAWKLNLTCVVSFAGKGHVLTWAPTFANFHSPSYFGKVPLRDVPWKRRHCGLETLAAHGQPGEMEVVAECFSGQPRGATLSVTMKQPDGTSVSQERKLSLTHVATTQRFSFPTEAAGKHHFVTTLRAPIGPHPSDVPKTTVLAERHAVATTPPPLETWLDRSVYTSQKQARLTIEGWQRGLAGQTFNVSITPSVSTARPIPTRLGSAGRSTVTLDLTDLPVGSHTVHVKPTNNTLGEATISCELIKLPNARGTVWYDDRGVLYKDNQPFFPVGFYYIQNFLKDGLLDEFVQSGMSSTAGYIDALKRMEPHDVNLILSIQNESLARSLQDRFWQTKDEERSVLQTAYYKHIETIARQVAASDPTNLIAWYIQDEPNVDILPFVKRSSDIVASADPRRPRLVVPCFSTVFRPYAEVVDILAPDPYPGFPDGPMVKVSSFIDEARAAMRYRRPAIAVLQSFGEPSGPAGAMPSAEELRCMTFLSVVHEARGVIYFSYSYNGPMRETHPQLWASAKTCARQIRQLGAEVLTASAGQLSLSQMSATRQVHSRIIQYDGNVYMIAVNTLRSPINNVRWTVNGLSDGPFEVLWEDRNLTVQKGMLMDDFAPLEVHFYRRRQ